MQKYLLFLLPALFAGLLAPAQSLRGLDKSPLDIAYFPDNFAPDRKAGEAGVVKVTYSRPQKNGRDLFGAKVPYGKVWRTGANESTEIKVYQDITFGGKTLKAGTYSLFSLPGEQEWEIILNADLDYWGAYSSNAENDLLRVAVPAISTEETVEAFTIQFQAGEAGQARMILAWDQTRVEVQIGF